MNKNIEVEGGEIAIRNSHGDLAIIPKDKRDWVKQKLSEGCHSCIDKLVETLPVMEDYAQDGSLYSEYLTPDLPTKKHPLDPNPDGNLPSYFKGSKENPVELNEVTVTEKAPQWLKYRNEYVKNNPFNIDEYVENRFNNPVGREVIEKIDQEGWRKKLKQEGLEKRYNSAMDYVGEQLVKNKPQGKLSRAEWLNQMTDKEEEIIKRNPKYQSSLWADTKRGLTSLVEQNPLQTFQNILNSSDYTNREKQELLKDYIDHPIMTKLGDAAKILNPLTIPSKMVQSAYKDDYSFTDALKGKKNNAGIVEDIATDPLNLIGVGLAGKLSKADKVIDATKAGSKVLNKTDDVKVINSILDNPKEIEAIKNNIKDISNDDIIKLEGYLKDTYDYEKLTPWQKNKLLDRESYYLKENNISVSDRIENDKKLLNFWEEYKKERKTYFESPKFRERLEKQIGKVDDETFNKYKSNLLSNLEKRPFIRPDVVQDYSAAHYKPKSHIGISEHAPGHTYYTDNSINKRIIEHEGRHQLTNADDAVYGFPSQQEIEANLIHPDLLKMDPDFMKNIGDKTGRDYYLSPEEFIVRLDELKRDLSKVGYDYMTEDLTSEILKKYRGLTPKEAISKVTGKSYGVRLNDLSPEQHKQVLQLLDDSPKKTTDASRLLRWFKEDFLIDQINNKWGLMPAAISTGAATLSQQQNNTK